MQRSSLSQCAVVALTVSQDVIPATWVTVYQDQASVSFVRRTVSSRSTGLRVPCVLLVPWATTLLSAQWEPNPASRDVLVTLVTSK